MKTFLITYIIIINLVGLIIMGVDKRRAKRQQWRIPEKTIFAIAIVFGSIGVLVGMYLFHHKTKKLRFAIGIPVILIIQLLLTGLLFFWNRQQLSRPSQTVQYELNLIQDLDQDTIQSFISYENLMNSRLSTGDINEETAEAVKLFFEKFKYDILNEEIQDDEAVVTVQITNINARELAHDLCREILKQSVAIFPDPDEATTSDYYELLYKELKDNSYDLVVSSAYFHLESEQGEWTILPDENLEDELVGGFISYMNDPYILSAQEALEIHLDALRELNADEWMSYLSIEDVFDTYNTEYYALIDEEYIRQLAADFDYEIQSCKESGNTAEAVISLTSVNMPEVLAGYKTSLVDYAGSAQSFEDSSVAISNEMSRLLLDALEENTDTITTDVTLQFSNNGSTWEIYFDSDFTNALMGDMNAAIEAFNYTDAGAGTEAVAETESEAA